MKTLKTIIMMAAIAMAFVSTPVSAKKMMVECKKTCETGPDGRTYCTSNC